MPASVLTIKYFIWLRTLATDIQFQVLLSNFHISNLLVIVIYMHIVHIQCLLRVDGSTLAGVFLTSSFCVVPESSYSSNEASGSLLVAWYTQTLVAPSQQCMASFQTSALEVATELAVVQLHRPLCVRFKPI